MSISFVASVTSFTNPGGPTDGQAWTFAIPVDAIAGDVVLLVIGSTVNVSSGCHATTAGWSTTLLWRGDDSDLVIVAAYALTGVESSPLTVAFTDDLNTNEAIPVALIYRGALVPGAASGASAFAAPPSFPSPSQTPASAGDWYIGIAHANVNQAIIEATPGDLRFDMGANEDGLAVFDLPSTSTAPFGIQTSLSSGAAEGSAHSLLLRLAPLVVAVSGAVDTTKYADLALVWDDALGNADLSVVDNDLLSDHGLTTAVILSLFTDRRAERDDVPTSGDPTDRRGWWADEFMEHEGDRIGSRLWLLDRSKADNQVMLRAKAYVLEALDWMIEDHVVTQIDVTTALVGHVLTIDLTLARPTASPLTLRFANVWDAIAA